MSQKDLKDLLAEQIKDLELARKVFDHSVQVCSKIGTKSTYSQAEADAYEALTSRFARLSDLLTHKVLRTIEAEELEPQGSLIDRINRAEKRGAIESAATLRKIRELRNEIAHEYSPSAISGFYAEVLQLAPRLMKDVSMTIEFCKKY